MKIVPLEIVITQPEASLISLEHAELILDYMINHVEGQLAEMKSAGEVREGFLNRISNLRVSDSFFLEFKFDVTA